MDIPVAFKQAEGALVRGNYLNFRDEGRVSPGSKTNLFTIISRHSGAILGHIKWFVPWRQYVCFPVNSVFDKICLREIADYCELVTNKYREDARAEAALKPKKLKRRFPPLQSKLRFGSNKEEVCHSGEDTKV